MALRVVDEAIEALDPDDRAHLRRLTAWWPMLADLCFSDLVLYLRTDGSAHEAGAEAGDDEAFVMATHIRPVTSQTIYPTVIEGEVRTAQQRPLVALAFRDRQIVEGEIDSAWLGEQIRVRAIPVRRGERVVAVITRESISSSRRAPGELEQSYAFVFDRLAAMIASGDLPFDVEDERLLDGPRVGDGVMVTDPAGAITFASPNALSALTRSQVGPQVVGRRLGEVGLERLGLALLTRRPASAELEMRGDVVISVRCVPLIERGEVVGGVVLVRDVTDLRRRDRLLVSKDASIREIHHRVKNNLQTISSLLRIQGRRLVEPTAREAIEESVRRIRSIALVHEILSRDPGEDVDLTEILRPLVRMVEEGLVSPDAPVRCTLRGDPGHVPSPTATSLAVVLSELLQNAVEHAYPADGDGGGGEIVLDAANDGHVLRISITDDGVGFPDGVDLAAGAGLGLSIVQTLVTTELGGSIEVERAGFPPPRVGTRFRLVVPTEVRPDAERPPQGAGAE